MTIVKFVVPPERKEAKQVVLFDENDDESLSPVEFKKSSVGSEVPSG